CPPGEACELGECIPGRRAPGRDAGVVATDAGNLEPSDAGPVGPRDAGVAPLSETGTDGGTARVDAARNFEFTQRGSCQCAAPGVAMTGSRTRAAAFGLALGLAARRRRRRHGRG
ncbi:MAG: hypothetical protein KGR47_12940, partial [Acidobacteria bacterium]|nr:hypothetical protein [Acidobacteriota bacterium]